MTSRTNVYIDQNTDFRLSLELEDDDGDPLAINSYSFFSTIKKMYSTVKVADFSIEKQVSNNTITLTLTDEQTGSMKPGKYQYDALMRKTSGEVVKLIEGLAFVEPSITDIDDLSSGTITGGDANGLTSGDNLDGGTY